MSKPNEKLALCIAQQCHKELLKTQEKVSRLMEKIEFMNQRLMKLEFKKW